MKFNLRAALKLLAYAALALFLSFLPHKAYEFTTRYMGVAFLTLAILATPGVFRKDNPWCVRFSQPFIFILVKLKVFGKNKQYDKANWCGTVFFALLLFIFSLAPEKIYQNIFVGVFSSLLVTALVLAMTYQYEKYIFCTKLIEKYIYIQHTSKALNTCLERLTQLSTSSTVDRIYFEKLTSSLDSAAKYITIITNHIFESIFTSGTYEDVSTIGQEILQPAQERIKNQQIRNITLDSIRMSMNCDKISIVHDLINTQKCAHDEYSQYLFLPIRAHEIRVNYLELCKEDGRIIECSCSEKIKQNLTLLMSCVNTLKEFNEKYSESYKNKMLVFGKIFDFSIPPIMENACSLHPDQQ